MPLFKDFEDRNKAAYAAEAARLSDLSRSSRIADATARLARAERTVRTAAAERDRLDKVIIRAKIRAERARADLDSLGK